MELFMIIAPHAVWLFVISPVVQIANNFRKKTYESGPALYWLLKGIGDIFLGIYFFQTKEWVLMSAQWIGLVLVIIVIIQKYQHE